MLYLFVYRDFIPPRILENACIERACVGKKLKRSNFLHVFTFKPVGLDGNCLRIKLIRYILCNIIILFFLLAGLPFAILTARHDPFKRGFFCNDESIQYPYKEDTISYELLAGIIVPFEIIVVSLHLIFLHYVTF